MLFTTKMLSLLILNARGLRLKNISHNLPNPASQSANYARLIVYNTAMKTEIEILKGR